MVYIITAVAAYFAIAFALALLSARFQWPQYFEPEDMWAWPIMLIIGAVSAPFFLFIYLAHGIGTLARRVAAPAQRPGDRGAV
jgi:hypothetical protein